MIYRNYVIERCDEKGFYTSRQHGDLGYRSSLDEIMDEIDADIASDQKNDPRYQPHDDAPSIIS